MTGPAGRARGLGIHRKPWVGISCSYMVTPVTNHFPLLIILRIACINAQDKHRWPLTLDSSTSSWRSSCMHCLET